MACSKHRAIRIVNPQRADFSERFATEASHSCMYARSAFEHSPTTFALSRSRDNIPPFVLDLLRTLPFLVHNLIPSPCVAYALFANKTEGTLPSSRTSQTATALPPFCPELSTPHGELLLAPSCNFLVSATYSLPPRKSFAALTKMIGEAEGCYVSWGPACTASYRATRAILRSNPSRHQLQSSFCPTCPGANSEVSG
jgi:hypothetical protein